MFADQDESFLTVAEVADLLKLNQQTVRNWIDQGSLPAFKVGRRVRIKRSDLDRVLERGYRAGSVEAEQVTGPSAEDFWGGEPVGMAEPDPTAAPAPDPAPDPNADADPDAPLSPRVDPIAPPGEPDPGES
jgi:excisionase family DNA binding protein